MWYFPDSSIWGSLGIISPWKKYSRKEIGLSLLPAPYASSFCYFWYHCYVLFKVATDPFIMPSPNGLDTPKLSFGASYD